MLRKVALYCGEQNYRYLPEIVVTLTDKPLDDEDFTEPDPDMTQWEEERIIPILDGNGCAIVVDKVVQQENKMVLNEAKSKFGIAKW